MRLVQSSLWHGYTRRDQTSEGGQVEAAEVVSNGTMRLELKESTHAPLLHEGCCHRWLDSVTVYGRTIRVQTPCFLWQDSLGWMVDRLRYSDKKAPLPIIKTMHDK